MAIVDIELIWIQLNATSFLHNFFVRAYRAYDIEIFRFGWCSCQAMLIYGLVNMNCCDTNCFKLDNNTNAFSFSSCSWTISDKKKELNWTNFNAQVFDAGRLCWLLKIHMWLKTKFPNHSFYCIANGVYQIGLTHEKWWFRVSFLLNAVRLKITSIFKMSSGHEPKLHLVRRIHHRRGTTTECWLIFE